MAVDAQPPNARPTPSCRTASDRRGGVWSQRPNRQTTCPRCGASTATPTILLRTCCRRQAGRGSRDAGGRACQSVDRDHRVQYRPSDRGVRSGFPGQGSSAPLLRIARSSRSIDRHWPSASRAKAQPQTDNLGSLEVAGGQGGWMLFAHQPAMPAAIVGRRKRTGRARPAKATSKEGASSQQGAAPQHLQRSFTARQIGTASNEAFVRFDKKISLKKRRAACATQLFKRPGTASACRR